jgi:hypothetical protein
VDQQLQAALGFVGMLLGAGATRRELRMAKVRLVADEREWARGRVPEPGSRAGTWFASPLIADSELGVLPQRRQRVL